MQGPFTGPPTSVRAFSSTGSTPAGLPVMRPTLGNLGHDTSPHNLCWVFFRPAIIATLRAMDIRAFQDTISEITGIETARVITEGGEPTEIHVLAHPGKPAKQLVRDIQTVAQAQFHTAIDRRIISVVQIEGADAIAGNRPVVKDVNESVDSSRITVSVELTWHDERMVGSATGPAAQSTKLRLVAEATLAALEQALDEDVAFGVSAADIKTVGSHPVAVAVIVLVLGGNERVLTGSAIGDGDPSRSMVRAVLDALNRHVPSLRRSV